MLSKILARPRIAALYRHNTLTRPILRRGFSSEVAEVEPQEEAPAAAPAYKATPPSNAENAAMVSSTFVNDMYKNLVAGEAAENKEYLDMLANVDAR